MFQGNNCEHCVFPQVSEAIVRPETSSIIRKLVREETNKFFIFCQVLYKKILLSTNTINKILFINYIGKNSEHMSFCRFLKISCNQKG